MYSNGKGSYETIIENIKKVYDVIRIKVRVNMDSENVDSAGKVLDHLEREGLKDKILVYFAPVNAMNEKCAAFQHECYTRQDFAPLETRLLKETLERGFAVDKTVCLPQYIMVGCGSISPHTIAIDAKGMLHKCWIPVGNDSEAFAQLNLDSSGNGNSDNDAKKDLPKDNLSKWLAYNPFDYEKCRECTMLPSCMGGCPWVVIGMKQEPECPTWKYNIKERVWLYREALERETALEREKTNVVIEN
jgi:uncharacterized protein